MPRPARSIGQATPPLCRGRGGGRTWPATGIGPWSMIDKSQNLHRLAQESLVARAHRRSLGNAPPASRSDDPSRKAVSLTEHVLDRPERHVRHGVAETKPLLIAVAAFADQHGPVWAREGFSQGLDLLWRDDHPMSVTPVGS